MKKHTVLHYAKELSVQIMWEIIGSIFIAIGIYNFAVQAQFPMTGFSGSTILNANGGYKGDKKQVVMCACNSKEMYQLRKTVKEADPQCFFVVVESHEVHGEGFRMLQIGEAEI